MGKGRSAEEPLGHCLGPARLKGPISCTVTGGEGPRNLLISSMTSQLFLAPFLLRQARPLQFFIPN